MRFARECGLIIVLSVSAVGGCAAPTEPWRPANRGAPSHLAQRSCPEDSPLTWDNFGAGFVLSWCTGCHSEALAEDRRRGAPLDVNLDRLDDVRANMDLIWWEAADHNVAMPPAGGPSAFERAQLGEWLACGAPTRSELSR